MDERARRPFRVEERRPVWSALSSLFLDTDTTLFTEYMVSTLAASPYSVAELDWILIDEVYPICHLNLFSIAGEWSGFNEEQLEERIMRRLNSPVRRFHWLNLGRVTVPTSLLWWRIKRQVAMRRVVPSDANGSERASNAG